MANTKTRPGRPKSDEPTMTITIRIPASLGTRLDQHLRRLEAQTGLRANRASIGRHALEKFLDAQEEEAVTRPRRRATAKG